MKSLNEKKGYKNSVWFQSKLLLFSQLKTNVHFLKIMSLNQITPAFIFETIYKQNIFLSIVGI